MKKILIIISVFAICFSFAVPVSADTENVLVYEFNAEWFVKRINNNYPGYVELTDDGCCTVVQFKSGAFSFYDVDNKSLYYLKPESTYFYTIDGEFNIYSNDLTALKPNVNFTGVKYMSFGLKGTGRKVKSVKVYEVVQAPFGHGGLAGNSSDIHYGVEVITNVFSKLWNVFTDYWWVMVGLCLPIAFYLLCILSDVFLKVPKGRFKPKIFSTGYYSGKKAYSSNSLTFDINKRKNRKGFGSSNNVHDVFIVDGFTYYNQSKYPRKKYKSRTKPVNVDINVDD